MTLKPSYHLLLYYWYSGMRSPRTIARKTGIALSTVTYNIKKLGQQGSLVHRGKNGRHSRITGEAARAIGQYIRSNCEVTAGQIAMKLETEKGIKVSIWTVQRYLRNAGYRNVLPRSKPMMTEEHRVRRLEWANARADDNWSQTVFSDETCFQLFRNTVRRWSKNPQAEVKRIPKNRQKVMVWGAISANGKIGLCMFEGIMNAKLYIDILKKNLLPAAKRHYGDDWRFQQDNDPKHTARVSKEFLYTNVPTTIDWPANSPDLNPIENIWNILKTRVERQHPSSLNDLKATIAKEWAKLENGVIMNLVDSMKSRIIAVIDSNGDHIKY